VVSSHSETPLGVGTSHGHLGPQDTPRPGLGEATTFPHIVFSATTHRDYIQMVLFPWTPKLESRNCPETIPVGVPGLWELITPNCKVWLQQGLNQTYSPHRDLSNDVSQSQFGGREEVDSRLLVVGSQIASLTPDPSFAHNLGNRCPNGQCEAIFDIYASRPFQWHQEHFNARCFWPCYRTLNIGESWRTPNPQLWKCWASPPHLAKVGLWQVFFFILLNIHFKPENKKMAVLTYGKNYYSYLQCNVPPKKTHNPEPNRKAQHELKVPW
jgi:hypothetical protein